MITISIKDFEHYGIKKFSNTITFMGKTFVPGQTFSDRFRQQAFELAEVNLNQNRPCLLIDYGTHVTLWQESISHLEPVNLAASGVNNQHPVIPKYRETVTAQEAMIAPGRVPSQETAMLESIPRANPRRSTPSPAKKLSQKADLQPVLVSVEDDQPGHSREPQITSRQGTQESSGKKYQMQYRGRAIR